MKVVGIGKGVSPTAATPDTKSEAKCQPTTKLFEGYRSGASAIPKAPPINKGTNIGRNR